jgi:two-component system, LytTR family, response regulator
MEARSMSYNQMATEVKFNPNLGCRCGLGEYGLKVIVAGQEEFTRRELRSILLAEQDVEILGESTDGLDAVDMVIRLRPNLVFLDIEMKRLNGFDIISNLDYLPAVALTSTLHQHATRAFEANALDFLLKPVSADRVKKALARARTAVALERMMAGSPAPMTLRDGLKGLSVSRLAVHKGKRVLLLSLKDIQYIKVENRLVYAFTEENQYLVNRTITELEELLHREGFFQINRGMIINLDYLCEIIPWFSGTCRLKLANGAEFPLSRDRVSVLKARVGLGRTWSGK